MRSLLAALGITLVLSPAVRGDIQVRIVDAPSKVIRYGPVWITARVTNAGPNSVLVPATPNPKSHYFIETGKAEDALVERRIATVSGGGDVVWLKPGESWLFRVDVGAWSYDVGRHFARAVLFSTGECQFVPTGGEQFPLKLLFRTPGMELYECWSGRATSETVPIDVVEPTSDVDRAALGYITSEGLPENREKPEWIQLRLGYRVEELIQRFPASNYTSVGAIYGCTRSPECLTRALEAGPGSDLKEYARVQWYIAQIRTGKAVGGSLTAEAALPPALKEYVAQEARRPHATRRQ